jgi:hypothetical protein
VNCACMLEADHFLAIIQVHFSFIGATNFHEGCYIEANAEQLYFN